MAKPKDQSEIEITSHQLLAELKRIKDGIDELKDRVGALENVAGISNQDILIKYLGEVIDSVQRQRIMLACREPRTREQLVTAAGFNSRQALNHHLDPLREGLIHETHPNGIPHFEWSLLFKRMPKKKVEGLLNGKKQSKSTKSDPA